MVILHITFTFNNFDFVYLSTGGGPVNATEVLPTFAYEQAWQGYALGYGAALGRRHARRAYRSDDSLSALRRGGGGLVLAKSPITRVFVYLGTLAFFAFFLLPIFWLVLSSFKTSEAITASRLIPLAGDLTLANYAEMFGRGDFLRYFANSLIIALTVSIVTTLLSSLGAYGLSRFALRGKSIFLLSALLPQFFPYVLMLIPFYLLMFRFGLVGTHAGIILAHTSITLPFTFWMLTGLLQRNSARSWTRPHVSTGARA